MIRDRMGIKPFYYAPTADGVLFGSEPKAILANPLARRAVTLDGLRELFAFVKTPGHAVWDGMHEVEPGTVVTVDRDGLHRRAYWTLETRPHTDDRATSIAHRARRCSTTSCAASWSPTCRAARSCPAVWTRPP